MEVHQGFRQHHYAELRGAMRRKGVLCLLWSAAAVCAAIVFFRPSSAAPQPQRAHGKPLQIASPAPGSVFRLDADPRQGQSIPLRATGCADGTLLHGFANGDYLGRSDRALEWPMQTGEWNFTCVTPQGARASATLRVVPARRGSPL